MIELLENINFKKGKKNKNLITTVVKKKLYIKNMYQDQLVLWVSSTKVFYPIDTFPNQKQNGK